MADIFIGNSKPECDNVLRLAAYLESKAGDCRRDTILSPADPYRDEIMRELADARAGNSPLWTPSSKLSVQYGFSDNLERGVHRGLLPARASASSLMISSR